MLVLALSACGSASSSSSSATSSPSSSSDPTLVSGVYTEHSSDTDTSSKPVAGVTIGVYPSVISSGPVMADPPSPITTVKTGADGTFSVHVSGRSRVFLAPIGNSAYSVGRWATVGGPPVALTGCTRCVRPL